ncbi:MAG: glycosyltransferase family 4 protein [Acidobacteriota bacterium]
MNRIKVVHLITKLELGGAQLNTVFTFENLNPEIFEVFLITGDGGILNTEVEEFCKMNKNYSGKFIMIKDLVRSINPIKDIKALLNLRKEFKLIKPDIIHTHSSKAGILGRLAGSLAGVGVVIHSVHGFSFSSHQSFLRRSFFSFAEKIISGLTTHFVFVSKNDIEVAEKKKLVKNKNYSLIRSGFPVKKFIDVSINKSAARKKYNINNSMFVCGIIAPFKPQKGLFHLIKIASLVLKEDKDILFIIAGDGTLREKIEYELEQEGISDNFRLPGFINDIDKMIPLFDIGLTTSLWEGLPQSLVQMRLNKKAVVASNIPGNNEIIINGENGYLIDIKDHKKFAEAILSLKSDIKLRKKLSFYNDNFAEWDGNFMVEAQEELYIELIKSR